MKVLLVLVLVAMATALHIDNVPEGYKVKVGSKQEFGKKIVVTGKERQGVEKVLA